MGGFLFDSLERYPIHLILGEPGSGKSLFGTYLAWLADCAGIPTFTNFHVFGFKNNHYIRYYMDYDKGKKGEMVNDLLRGFAEDGTKIEDGLILWDEPQSTGLEKHAFWSVNTIELAKFVSQIRKRGLGLILITQIFDRIVYDVRSLVAFIYEIHPTITKGIVNIWRLDYGTREYMGEPIMLDLRSFFHLYNTKEEMGVKPDAEENEKTEGKV